ncbi:MAG: hypothetical protein BIFFINMI_00219 [Phycisphaerae bacterium]|nr:hypothetical protein [Phycisphaerae bacterium]
MTRSRLIGSAALVIASLVAFAAPAPVLADGMIVPIRRDLPVRGSWAVKYHKVNIKVRDQVADVTVDQAFVNTGGGMVEVEYLFPLPPTAAIDGLTLLVDGKEFKGKVLKADEARKIYEEIVRSKRDPALLEYVNYGVFKTSAFPLMPGKEARVVVHYTDVCRRDHNLVEVFYPLNTEKFSAKALDEVEVKVDIKAEGSIAAVYSPTHEITVKRPEGDHVTAVYQVKGETPTTDFRLLYQAPEKEVGATVLSYRPRLDEPGYFLMLASPRPQAEKKVQPKDVVVLFDRSGSMAGDKLDQAKASLSYVIKNLNEGDRFNVVVYNDAIDPLFDRLVENTKANVDKALTMLDRVDARGGTNIHDALETGLRMAASADTRARGLKIAPPKYILFLTDGLPTIGTTDEKTILKDTVEANKINARVFAMGIGYDVNVRLLDKLVRENRGVSSYVKEKEPLEAKISSLYGKIKNPVMTSLAINFTGVKTPMTYPQVVGDLFDGDQIVLVGRYDTPGPTNLLIKGDYLGKQQTFEYGVELAKESDKFTYAFIEPLWAVRRIGYLLDQIQLNGESTEVIDELVRLSKQYGIITPYTSFLADERTVLSDASGLRAKGAAEAADLGGSISGGRGQMHAENRAKMNTAAQAPKPGAAWQYGQGKVADYEQDKQEQVATVLNAGQRSFYKRGNQWVQAELTSRKLDEVNKDAKEVKQFSDEYFALVGKNNTVENQILAAQVPGQELVLELRGQVYRIAAATH